MTNKGALSKHVEKIFKQYTKPGLHICDIATGGGKSYTIGKLACEYYPEHFDRIVILCIQKKLVYGMNDEIFRFIHSDSSLITPNDVLVIQSNTDAIIAAAQEGSYHQLIDEMKYQLGEQQRINHNSEILNHLFKKIKSMFDNLKNLIETIKSYGNTQNEYIKEQIENIERQIRCGLRNFFEAFKRHLVHTKQMKNVSMDYIIKRFPSLLHVYPQVGYKNKRIVLTTIHKALLGIDPILSSTIRLTDFPEEGKKTLILFDESDQAAVYMRNAIIDQAIKSDGGYRKFANGYNGYLLYRQLATSSEIVSGSELEKGMNIATKVVDSNWQKLMKKTKPYTDIFLSEGEDIEYYRRGVFFSGPAVKLSISPKKDKTISFICYEKGTKHLNLSHSDNEKDLSKQYDIVVHMDDFLALSNRNIRAIKSQLRKIVEDEFQKSKDRFKQLSIAANSNQNIDPKDLMAYPTLDREIHTLFSRFAISSRSQYEQQLVDFITNRKNLSFQSGSDVMRFPDYSVYTQGVQLYQEEIDEFDNKHHVTLSCREITTTPEKIIYELVNKTGTSVVLCSATSSCKSVVSNFDIRHLSQVLGNNYLPLQKELRCEFDTLVDKTNPQNHKIEIVPLVHHMFEEPRMNKWKIPPKYKALFDCEAQDAGLADKWFKYTKRELIIMFGDCANDLEFHFYRLFQFIEAYHWFMSHDDIHSMIYFQNRSGEKDKVQINVLSCLIDGTYKSQPSEFEDAFPKDWVNEHICISKDGEEVNNKVLQTLSSDPESKLMLVSAYGSFKAGANLQYNIPEGLKFCSGDNWEEDRSKWKKDWDAIYLQSPTAYLLMSADSTDATYEKELYNVMLVLTMLYERGYLSLSEVSLWLNCAISKNFNFSEKISLGIKKDKSAWALTIIEQAVGRLCRTRNKPLTTYILFDDTMTDFFSGAKVDKSLTREYSTLLQYITQKYQPVSTVKEDELILCNTANQAQCLLDRMRGFALYYTPKKYAAEELYDDDADEDEISEALNSIIVNQKMNQCYKKTIISRPVIDSLDDLTDEDKRTTFITKCYGNWQRDDAGRYFYGCTDKNRICPISDAKLRYSVSPETVRLDVLMKNDIIKHYFIHHGYATSWKSDGLILHPQILVSDYAGEIGEEAFMAIVLACTDCKPEMIRHLEDKDYELADFVICNPDGSYKIAFDVKNMCPDIRHDDKPNDLPTREKRAIKRRRLGCNLITVNMIEIKEKSMDDITEISGIINKEGMLIPSAIEQLQNLINN